MELGKKIRQLRFKAGLTQEQLAEKLGVAAQSVSKWENAVAMPDISALPLLAEVFGVSIDDLFDLTAEQRLNRIENRMDAEEDLPQDVFWEYEEFLKSQLSDPQNKQRATDLMAYLYWHKMNAYAGKAARYAKEAVRMAPGVKGSQWVLNKAAGHAAWDWNVGNHTEAIEFWQELAEANPRELLPWVYLLDNLLADRRADEAERVVEKLPALGEKPVLVEIYRAHVALARFDEAAADRIVEELLSAHPDDAACLFEAAQYFAAKCDYDRAVELYELSFQKTDRRPRFQDELMGIADIYRIKGEYGKAAETCDRIVDLLEHEWGLTEADDSSVQAAKAKRDALRAKAQ